MVKSITFSEFTSAFHTMGRYDQFNYHALRVIYDYLEECAPDFELDVISICCDFSVDYADTIARDYSIDLSHLDAEDDDYEEQCEAAVIDYLNDHTSVLGQCRDGIVYQQF